MRDEHLTPETLERLLEGESDARNRLLLHHLAVCPECRVVGGHVLDLYLAGEIGLELCTVEIALAKSRKEAPALRDELLPLPLEEQKARIEDEAHFRSWGLAELLCSESEEEAARDPKKAAELAGVAAFVALSIGEWDSAEKHWAYLLRGYSFAHLANAFRAQGDLRAAEKAFIEADSWWTPAIKDVGDVLGYEARFLAFKASLRRDERRFREALELVRDALEANPLPALRLRILINKAKTYEDMGDLETAIEILKDVAAKAEEEESDPRVRLCLAQNRLDYLSKAERYMEAKLALADVRALASDFGTGLDSLRLRWTEARITKGLGDTEAAIASFKEIHDELARQGLPFDASFLALELALVFKETGRPAEAMEWVKGTLPILSSLSVEREALAAVALLATAVAEERITAELVSQALDVFRRAKH